MPRMDHPQRALYAALLMQQQRRQFAQRLVNPAHHRLKPVLLEARVGVNSGEVVMRTVQTGGHTEYAASPWLAAFVLEPVFSWVYLALGPSPGTCTD
jgi:hypothetical protein